MHKGNVYFRIHKIKYIHCMHSYVQRYHIYIYIYYIVP